MYWLSSSRCLWPWAAWIPKDRTPYWARISKIRFEDGPFGVSFCRHFCTAWFAIDLNSAIAACMSRVLCRIGIFARSGKRPHFISSGSTVWKICMTRQFSPCLIAWRSIPKATSPTKSRVSNTFNREKSTTSLLDAALSKKLTHPYPWSAYALDVVTAHLRTKRCLFKLENWALTTTGPNAGAKAFLCLCHLLWSIWANNALPLKGLKPSYCWGAFG